MNFSMNLSNGQFTKLSLTPALQRSIDILQLHTADLYSYLQELSIDNPLIEIEYSLPQDSYDKRSKLSASTDFDSLSRLKVKEDSLEQLIIKQLRMMNAPSPVLKAACFLAGNLNDDGYLQIELPQAAVLTKLPLIDFMDGLTLLHRTEPAGIGARNLSECLELQIDRDPVAPVHAKAIARAHLQELAYGKLQLIAKKLKATISDIETAVTYIKKLNPKPGLGTAHIFTEYVALDAEICETDGRINIRLLEQYLPQVSISSHYLRMASSSSEPDTGAYIREKLQEAKFVIRGIEQRKKTLYRVIEAIFETQSAFLLCGPKELKPLSLKDISNRLQLHESTISRAVQNKFIQTPYGIVNLKYFFSTGLSDQTGQHTSQTAIKNRIKEIIDREPRHKPYSDNQVVEILRREGLQLSRRTVTKYREEMRILSSLLRKSL